jgi:hypothetical protein
MFSQIIAYFKEKTRIGEGSKEVRELAEVYEAFAKQLEERLPHSGEGVIAIRKLLESRDAAIRSITY